MRVLIQHVETGLFLGKAGGWVTASTEARDFRRTTDAVVYCAVEHLTEIRIALSAEEYGRDVFYYPFENAKTREESKKLGAEARALKRKRNALVKKIRAHSAAIADLQKTLPLPRKKKRSKPPNDP